MSLRTILPIIRERWISIVVTAVLAVLASAAVTWQQTPVYAARATLFVSALGNSTDTLSAYQGSLFSFQRVKSYPQLIEGERVMSAVATQLNLSATPDQLAAKTTVKVVPETVLLAITVTDSSAARAQAIANAIADRFIELLPELENMPAGKQSPVRVSVVNRASKPSVPFSPQPTHNLALGLVLGLVVGAGLAAARHALDTTFKNTREITEITQIPALGTVPFDPNATKSPLVIADSPVAPRSEAFRKIRTSLQFVDLDRTCKVVFVTSAVAGEGKSSTACNLAVTLAEAGKRVLLIDADLRRPSAARYLGLPTGVGLTSVLVGSATLAEATQRWGDLLSVLASGPIPPNPSELLGSAHMRALLDHLRQMYDHVVIDGPPVLPVADAAATAAASDGTILVIRHGKTRREQVADTVTALRTVDAQILGTILNLVPMRGKQNYYQEYGQTGTPGDEPAAERAVPQLAGSRSGAGVGR